MRWRALLCAAWLGGAQPLWAEGLLERLERLETLAGRFEQTIEDSRGAVLEQSSGSFALRKPASFRWQIEAPSPQLLLLGEESMIHYDSELETAIREPVDGEALASPLAILAGGEALENHYRIERLGERSYRLDALREQGQIAWLHVEFEGALVASMRIADRLGQLTRIEFADVVMNAPLADALFEFAPPPGVDFHDNH